MVDLGGAAVSHERGTPVLIIPRAGATGSEASASAEAGTAPGKGGGGGGRFVSAKSKLSAKRGKGSQREVLEAMGVPPEEVCCTLNPVL